MAHNHRHAGKPRRQPQAVIIGMMGAGKTRLGKEMAQMRGLPFLDADVEIEREIGMSIPDYFAQYGEPAFREVERDVVCDILDSFGGIFSLGGGAPMTKAIRRRLAQYVARGGKVVYLKADPHEAMERANREAVAPCSQAMPRNAGCRCSDNATPYTVRWRIWSCQRGV